MKERPLIIRILSAIYMVAPLTNLIFFSIYTGLPLFGPSSFIQYLSIHDKLILWLFPLIGIGLYQVHLWGWIVFMAATATIIGFNIYSSLTTHTYSAMTRIFFNASMGMVTFLVFRKHIRAPYFNPRLRWWESDPRYRVHFGCTIADSCNFDTAEVVDISKSGIHIHSACPVEKGSHVKLSLHFEDFTIDCTGKVMRIAREDEEQGFGIMFKNNPRKVRRDIDRLIKHISSHGARERNGIETRKTDATFKENFDRIVKILAWELLHIHGDEGRPQ
jgi:hypothetical protein